VLLVVFVLDNPFFVALLAAGGVVGLAIGVLLIARPGAGVGALALGRAGVA